MRVSFKSLRPYLDESQRHVLLVLDDDVLGDEAVLLDVMEDKELDKVASARWHQPAEAQRQPVNARDVGHQWLVRPLPKYKEHFSNENERCPTFDSLSVYFLLKYV